MAELAGRGRDRRADVHSLRGCARSGGLIVATEAHASTTDAGAHASTDGRGSVVPDAPSHHTEVHKVSRSNDTITAGRGVPPGAFDAIEAARAKLPTPAVTRVPPKGFLEPPPDSGGAALSWWSALDTFWKVFVPFLVIALIGGWFYFSH